MGFYEGVFEWQDFDVTVYDLGGGPKIRGIWPQYFSEVIPTPT